jgi:sugar O-acyltransferase (sialic acid O-acetyltransferase NeuD family)
MEIILVGGFIEIIELCEEIGHKIKGIIDLPEKTNFKYPVLGNEATLAEILIDISDIPVIITPDNPHLREKLSLIYRKYNFAFPALISPTAKLSYSASIGEGTIVQHGVNISSESKIGKFVKLNTHSNVAHNVTIGDFTTVAPNAVVLGYITIGQKCYIGANATILPGIKICDNVVIGAGSVVTGNIDLPGSLYAGVPAKLLKIQA